MVVTHRKAKLGIGSTLPSPEAMHPLLGFPLETEDVKAWARGWTAGHSQRFNSRRFSGSPFWAKSNLYIANFRGIGH